jgi:hypothetical protein
LFDVIKPFVFDHANGHAARVHAWGHAGGAQFALATRDGSGRLRLGNWQAVHRNMQLSWTARETARGWVVEEVELR